MRKGFRKVGESEREGYENVVMVCKLNMRVGDENWVGFIWFEVSWVDGEDYGFCVEGNEELSRVSKGVILLDTSYEVFSVE